MRAIRTLYAKMTVHIALARHSLPPAARAEAEEIYLRDLV